jgi:8-oxo-dGTP diphosphatase
MLLQAPYAYFDLSGFLGRRATGVPVAGDDAEEVGWYGAVEMAALPVTASTLEIARRIAAESGE